MSHTIRRARFAPPAALAAAVALVISLFLQPAQTAHAALITDCTSADYAGADLTIDTTSSKLGGQHYNIATFTVNNGVTLLVCNTADGGDGTLTVSATNIAISGTIDGNSRGSAGGARIQWLAVSGGGALLFLALRWLAARRRPDAETAKT